MDLHSAFKIGAKRIAKDEKAYTDLHKAHGIEQAHWELLTAREYWTPDEARAIRSILANVVEVSMTIAGMPAIPLPGQYVAALIAETVAPCNWMLAAVRAPDTFDAMDASGLMAEAEVRPMEYQQMMGLILAYGGQYHGEPGADIVPRLISDEVSKQNTSVKAKKTV